VNHFQTDNAPRFRQNSVMIAELDPKDSKEIAFAIHKAVRFSGLSLSDVCDRLKQNYQVELTPSGLSHVIHRGTIRLRRSVYCRMDRFCLISGITHGKMLSSEFDPKENSATGYCQWPKTAKSGRFYPASKTIGFHLALKSVAHSLLWSRGSQGLDALKRTAVGRRANHPTVGTNVSL